MPNIRGHWSRYSLTSTCQLLCIVSTSRLTHVRGLLQQDGASGKKKKGRTEPFNNPEYKQAYQEQMAKALPRARDSSGYSPPLQKEFDRRLDTVALSLHAQIAAERALAAQGGWQGTMDKSIQKLQDKRVFKDGDYLQQAMDQLRLDRNHAVHKPFGEELVRGSGAGSLQRMLPGPAARGPPSAHGSRPKSRFAVVE
jgi:hypothetical protein